MTSSDLLEQADAALQAGNYASAIDLYRRAIAQGVSDPYVFFALGYALAASGARENAITEYDRALALDPTFIEVIANRGVLLKDMGRLTEALAAFDRAIALNPNIAESHNQRGTVLHELKRAPEAFESFKTALTLKPDYAKAMLNIGNVLGGAGSYDKALIAYERAMSIAPGLPTLQDARLHAAMHVCDWTDFSARCQSLFAQIECGAPAQPFVLLCLPATLAQQRICAQNFAREKCPPQKSIFQTPRKPGRLRIAYVGASFRHHAVALLVTGMMEKHDRTQFEIFGISHGPNDNSDTRRRMIAACEHFTDAKDWDDKRIAEHIRDQSIDIAIDLDGYTEDARPAILSHRPAPIQASYIGFTGTMGASHIDYIIADDMVAPAEHAPHYSEKIIRLPVSYMPDDIHPDLPAPTRTECGLPETGFVYGCFNSAHKITPMVFDVWMKILARVENSVLWLLVSDAKAQDNLRREAIARDIDPMRLIFAPRIGWQGHLARQQQMDLFLDTFIYNAHTTAGDALWSGVPLVTMLGETFPARVAASLLTAAGVPELITHAAQDYENLAVTLAADPARLAGLRQRLRQTRATSALFDSAKYARNLEAAFRQISE